VTVVTALLADAGATVTSAAFQVARCAIVGIGIRAAGAINAGRDEMADVRWRADRAGDADTINAGVVDGTGITVTTTCAIWQWEIDALTCVGIARSILQTWILRGAVERRATTAGPVLLTSRTGRAPEVVVAVCPNGVLIYVQPTDA
jgi:hypothetical protein